MSNILGEYTMEELIRFEGTNVHIIQDENGEPLFEIYSTGMALGHIKKNAVGNYYPRKERIDDNLKNAEITPCVRDGHSWINESQLYDFMLEARTDKCRKFRKWVVNEVLPSIRKTGMYTTPKPPYTYSDKTFHGKPVMTLADISLIFSMNYYALYPYVKNTLLQMKIINCLKILNCLILRKKTIMQCQHANRLL